MTLSDNSQPRAVWMEFIKLLKLLRLGIPDHKRGCGFVRASGIALPINEQMNFNRIRGSWLFITQLICCPGSSRAPFANSRDNTRRLPST